MDEEWFNRFAGGMDQYSMWSSHNQLYMALQKHGSAGEALLHTEPFAWPLEDRIRLTEMAVRELIFDAKVGRGQESY